MRLYFAYSSALDGQAFDDWKNQHGFGHFTLPAGRRAVALDERLIFDFPSRFWGGRALGLEPNVSGQVAGMVFEIQDPDWGIVQHKEGVVTGAAIEKRVRVRVEGAKEEVEATAFVTNPARRSLEGPVSEAFLEAVRRAYRSRELGDAALNALDAAAAAPSAV